MPSREAAVDAARTRDLLAPDWWFWPAVGGVYGLVLCCMVAVSRLLAWATSPWAAVLVIMAAVLAIGALQLMLIHASHETWHRPYRGRPWSQRIAALALGYPLGLTRQMRAEHMRHHGFPGDAERDPEFALYGRFPRSRLEMIGFVLVNLSGLAALRQFLGRTGGSRTDVVELASLMATQLAIAVAMGLALFSWAYLVLWLVPLVCVAKTLAQLRGLAEHGGPGGEIRFRSFRGSGPATWVLGSFGFARHAEHHLLPSVPCGKLANVTRMVEAGAVPGRLTVEPSAQGHLRLLWGWFQALPWSRR